MPVDSKTLIRRLRAIGFSSTSYLEAVAVLEDEAKNVVNVVPLGFRLRGGRIVVRVFRGSRTYDAMVSGLAKRGFVCVTHDARLFYYSVFDKGKALDMLSRGRVCSASVGFEVEAVEVCGRGYALATLRPTEVEILRRTPVGLVRASALAVEALVWLTKIPYASKELRARYAEYVRMCVEGMRRSSKSSTHRAMAKKIAERLRDLVEGSEKRIRFE